MSNFLNKAAAAAAAVAEVRRDRRRRCIVTSCQLRSDEQCGSEDDPIDRTNSRGTDSVAVMTAGTSLWLSRGRMTGCMALHRGATSAINEVA